MAKYVATPVGSGFGAQSNLNQSFEEIEDNFQRVLYRDGSSPNQMEANIDMNGFTIYNAGSVSADSMTINGQVVVANETFVTQLPDPVGQGGKFIKSDGAAASWQLLADDDVLFNQDVTGSIDRSVVSKLKDFKLSVKDFGAVGDGTTDDTAAIQAAYDYQDSAQTSYASGLGPVAGYTPIVHFPPGKYKISATINANSDYMYTTGDRAILIKAAVFTGTAAIQNAGLAWRVFIHGLQFADFAKAIYLDSTNVNSGLVSIKDCGFFGITDYAIHTDCQSTAVVIADCIFRSCKHELLAETGDMVVMRGGWISRGVLTADYDGGIVIQDPTGVFRMEDVLCVPTTQSVVEPCWIKNYGTTLLRGVRFGGEAGAHTAVNNYNVGSAVTQDDKRGVSFEGCEVYIGANNPALRLFEIPSYISIKNSHGFTGTGDSAIEWSSSISGGDQTTKIAVIGTTVIRHIIDIDGINLPVGTPSNLDFITNKPTQRLLMSASGDTKVIHDFRSSSITAGQVYGREQHIGRDGSANASGVRFEARVEATGTAGGVKKVYATAANSSTTLTDTFQIDATGTTLLAGNHKNTVRTFTASDTTPDVSNGNLFQTANAAPTSITTFDGSTTGQQFIVLVDANTTIVHGSTVKLAGGANFVGTANDTISFVNVAGVFYEVCRSVNG